jgi:2-hydroxychromene-2-carboxylate isomerase
MNVDYYFTPVSPWTFLGHDRFVQLLQDTGSTVRVMPVDYGVIFPVSGGLPLARRAPQRQAYRLLELGRFAEHLGVPLNPQPAFFPVSADAASKLIVAVDRTLGPAAALHLGGRIGRAIWVEQRDAADAATLRSIVAEAGLPEDLWARSLAPDVAEAYAAHTQRAIDAGVFGAPSYVVDGEIFWGQDRLDFLARRLQRRVSPP